MAQIYGKGHELLAFFNIDYHEFIEEITAELMSNPNRDFSLSIKRVPLKESKHNDLKSVSTK